MERVPSGLDIFSKTPLENLGHIFQDISKECSYGTSLYKIVLEQCDAWVPEPAAELGLGCPGLIPTHSGQHDIAVLLEPPLPPRPCSTAELL